MTGNVTPSGSGREHWTDTKERLGSFGSEGKMVGILGRKRWGKGSVPTIGNVSIPGGLKRINSGQEHHNTKTTTGWRIWYICVEFDTHATKSWSGFDSLTVIHSDNNPVVDIGQQQTKPWLSVLRIGHRLYQVIQ